MVMGMEVRAGKSKFLQKLAGLRFSAVLRKQFANGERISAGSNVVNACV